VKHNTTYIIGLSIFYNFICFILQNIAKHFSATLLHWACSLQLAAAAAAAVAVVLYIFLVHELQQQLQ